MSTRVEERALTWERNPWRELIRLAWPLSVSMVSFSVMTLVDTLFVGKLGQEALAAVGLGGIGALTLLCFGLGFFRGVKVLVAQAVGAGRLERAGAVLRAGLVWAVLLGIGVALLGQLLALTMPSIAIGERSGDWARSYTSIRTLAAPVVLAAACLREALYGRGESTAPMRATLVANLSNVLLNAVFIFALGWGVAGAALGSALAQALELGVLLRALFARGEFPLAERGALSEVWRLGAPLGFERLLDVGSFSAMVALFARMGDRDLAAHQIAVQVVHFAFLPAMAVGDATCVLAGQATGARRSGLLRPIALYGVRLAGGYTLLCALVFALSGEHVVQAFTEDLAARRLAAELLFVMALALPIHSVYCVALGVLRGTGDVRYTAWICVLAAWLCTPTLAFFLGMGLGFGAVGGWMGIGVELCLASTLLWHRLSTSFALDSPSVQVADPSPEVRALDSGYTASP